MRIIPIILAAFLAGCGGTTAKPASTPTPNVAACETAMRQQLAQAQDPNAPSGTRPPECAGVDDATLQRLAEKIMGEVLNGG